MRNKRQTYSTKKKFTFAWKDEFFKYLSNLVFANTIHTNFTLDKKCILKINKIEINMTRKQLHKFKWSICTDMLLYTYTQLSQRFFSNMREFADKDIIYLFYK